MDSKQEIKNSEIDTQIQGHLREILALVEKKNIASNISKARRFSLFPIQDEVSYKFFKKQEGATWSANEMDFVRDKMDYENLPPKQKHLINLILGFFSPADGLVSENLLFRFLMECETYEEKAMFIAQLFIELVHAETYSLAIMTYIPDPVKQQEVFDMANNLPCVKTKTDWIERYMNSEEPRVVRLAAFAIAEGVFFSMLFSIIFWFRSKGVMQIFAFSNEQISKDEGLHRDYGAYLFRKLFSQISDSKEREAVQEKVLQIMRDAVDIESSFIDNLVPDPIDDLNKEDLHQYCHVVADNLLATLELPTIWNDPVPASMSWMNDISLSQKNNFYEIAVGSYKNFSLTDALDWKKRAGVSENMVDAIQNSENVDF